MSTVQDNEQPVWEKIIELAEQKQIPQSLRDFWKQEHGIDPAEAAVLIQAAIQQDRVSLRYFYAFGFGSVGLLVAVLVIGAALSIQAAALISLPTFVLGGGAIVWRSKALDKRATANRKRGESLWDFAEAFDEFMNLFQPVQPDVFTNYSHQGLKGAVERPLRTLARLVLEEEEKAGMDNALPRVVQVTDRSQSLHWRLVQAAKQMKVLGLSDGDYGRYYMLAKRDLK